LVTQRCRQVCWAVELEAQSKYLDHYLDFFFVGVAESSDCLKIMDVFF